jgi:hypothetical protein
VLSHRSSVWPPTFLADHATLDSPYLYRGRRAVLVDQDEVREDLVDVVEAQWLGEPSAGSEVIGHAYLEGGVGRKEISVC